MKLPDLCRLTGVSARQVRYLISENIVPPPTGGRAHARYDDRHVQAVRRYQQLKEMGFAPASIRILMEMESGVPMPLLPGVALLVDPGLLADNDTDLQVLVQHLQQCLQQHVKAQGATHDESPNSTESD